jgi:hypothetical protein
MPRIEYLQHATHARNMMHAAPAVPMGAHGCNHTMHPDPPDCSTSKTQRKQDTSAFHDACQHLTGHHQHHHAINVMHLPAAEATQHHAPHAGNDTSETPCFGHPVHLATAATTLPWHTGAPDPPSITTHTCTASAAQLAISGRLLPGEHGWAARDVHGSQSSAHQQHCCTDTTIHHPWQ